MFIDCTILFSFLNMQMMNWIPPVVSCVYYTEAWMPSCGELKE